MIRDSTCAVMCFVLFVVICTISVGVTDSKDIRATYNTCCKKGEEMSQQGQKCGSHSGPVPGIPPEQQSICLSAIDICCSKMRREQQCTSGLNIAKQGQACVKSTEPGADYNKDCCEACKLGLMTGSLGNGCDPGMFQLLPPASSAYQQCCENVPTEIPITSTTPLPLHRNTSHIPPPPPIDNLCELFPKQLCEHICVPEPGSYHCECRPGYVLLSDKNSCKLMDAVNPNAPLNRCEANNPCEQQCIDTGEAIKCYCDEGFVLAADQISCDDIDECKLGRSTCDPYTEICRNTIGSFVCDLKQPYTNGVNDLPTVMNCPSGYFFNAYTQKCDDVDECAEGLDDCNRESQDCLNTYGNFTCQNKVSKKTCPPGFKRNIELGNCEDINECEENNPCAFNEICNNVSGGYQCEPISSSIPLRTFDFPVATSRNPLQKPSPSSPSPSSPSPVDNANNRSLFGWEGRPTPNKTEPAATTSTTPRVALVDKSNWESESRQPEDRVLTVPTTVPTSVPTTLTPLVTRGEPKHNEVLKNVTPPTCEPGYRYDPSGQCVDINECYEEIDDCDSNQDCYNTRGSYDCRCKSGFQLHPITKACVDVNECQQDPNLCDRSSQRCANTPGSYRCTRIQSCGTGYTLNDATNVCEDDDECVLNTHNCNILGPNYQCRNTVGSFRCERKKFYRQKYFTTKPPTTTRLYTSPPQVTIPSSTERPYTSQPRYRESVAASTVPVPAPTIPFLPPRKTCFPGFRLNAWGNCEDINECAERQVCRSTERCINVEGGYRCEAPQCPAGKQLSANGTRCVDIDECALGTHKCGPNEKCVNKDGGYLCQCQPGHMLAGDKCEDIDECERFKGRICAQNSVCQNTIGSFRCVCKEGFRSVSDTQCEDIDECRDTPGLCDQICINYWGAYRCACRQGYRLSSDNRTCTDIDECTEFKDQNLCIGFCVNTQGSYTCRCPPGYKLSASGRTCKDIDECESTTTCRKDEICLNMRGSYRCQRLYCPVGYKTHPEYPHRCRRDDTLSPCYGSNCPTLADTISFNYITIPSLLPVPDTGFNDLFQMRGPRWTNFSVKFSMKLESVHVRAAHVKPVDINYFQMRQNNYNEAVVGMVRSIEGPQDIELSIQMTIFYNNHMQSIAIAKLFVYVSEYPF